MSKNVNIRSGGGTLIIGSLKPGTSNLKKHDPFLNMAICGFTYAVYSHILCQQSHWPLNYIVKYGLGLGLGLIFSGNMKYKYKYNTANKQTKFYKIQTTKYYNIK